jgi:hypothetical protein
MLTLLAYPMIICFEKIFSITSDITLIELTNTNAPLLREWPLLRLVRSSIRYRWLTWPRMPFTVLVAMRCWLGQGPCIMILVKWKIPVFYREPKLGL